MSYPLSTEETIILTTDIGNSAIKFGLFEGDNLTGRFSIPTQRDTNDDDISGALAERLKVHVDSVIVCSVVPDVDDAMASYIRDATGVDPIFVTNSFDFGFKITYQPLESLGTDRLVNAYSAVEKYGAPCIVCSLGTATTIDVVSADREFLGGIIAPGLDAMAEALHMKAPRLPRIDTSQPADVIGNSTVESIRSGIYHGYVAMVEGLITRIRTESGVARVVGTGGNAPRLADEFAGLMIVEEDLLLSGLKSLAERQDWPANSDVAKGDKH